MRAESGRGTITGSVLIAILALGCSGDIKSGPTIGPASLELVAGDQQLAAAGMPLPVQPSVRVIGENGAPLAEATVRFAVEGGGSITAQSARTDADGLASIGWTLGPTAGNNTLTATVAGLAGVSLQFAAIGVPGPAAKLGVATAVPAAAGNDLPFVPQPVFLLEDAFDNVIPGQAITVSVSIAGGPGGAVLTGATATSDPTGQIAFTGLKLKGPAGQYNLLFQSPSLPAMNVAVVVNAGVPARLAIVTQPADSAWNGIVLSRQPVVQLVDASDNPVHQTGIVVTATVESGGGSLGGTPTSVSDQGGIEQFTNLSLNGAPGPRTLRFSAVGLASVTSDTILLRPAPPSVITKFAGDGQSAESNTAVPINPSVLVKDGFGTPLAGVVVSFAPGAGSGTVAVPSVATNAQGLATPGSWVLGAVGSNTLVATATGLTGSPLTFTATAIPGAPAQLSKIAGDLQNGTAGSALAESLVVRLTDAHGNGLPGLAISWTASAGSISSPALTDASGRAAVRWTLGPVAGPQSVTATVAGLTSSFTATAVAGPPAGLSKLSGDNQTGTVGVALPESLVVRLTDTNGNGVSGRAVTWNAADGSVSPSSSQTDANGRAAAQWTAGANAGPQGLDVTTAGFTASFSATAVPGIPGALTVVAGDGQSGAVGTVVAESLVVRVTDANGNGVAGRTVNWTTTSGSAIPATSLTDANGLAGTSWVLGPAAGSQTLIATSPGIGGSVTFVATAFPGAAARLVEVSGDSQIAPAGTTLAESLVVRVTDASGNPLAGKSVNWTTASGSLAPASSITDANGLAATSWTLGSSVGPQSGLASTPGVAGSITFAALATAGVPTGLSKLLGDNQTGAVGSALAESLVVRLVDANGNGVAGRAVTWTASAGAISPANTITSASGRAAVRWTLGPTAGPQSVTVSSAGLTATFAATATPGTPGSITLVTGGNQSGPVGSVLAESLVVRVADANGNGVAGRTVTWTALLGTVAPASSTTDANGLAATSWTLGVTAGAQTVTATSPGLTGVVVNFTATAVPGPATILAKVLGDNQSGNAGAVLPESLVVRLTDANGNGIAGRTVNWTTISGSLSPVNTVTDPTGRAAAKWTVGSSGGAQIALATMQGLQAAFTATVIPSSSTMHPVFSTFLGGTLEDQVRDIAVDQSGFIYVVGGTASSNFPTTSGAYDRSHNGNYDVYVAKLTPQGQLVWSTLLGGPNYDRAYAVEVDAQGFVYVAGRAGASFPVTAGAFQTAFHSSPDVLPYGPQDGFVCKLNPNGASVRFCSYFGTDDPNIVRDIALDSQGGIYLASSYQSGSFPSSWFRTGFQRNPSGGADAVIAKVANNGSSVSWLTFVGGSQDEAGEPSIRVDASGNVFALYSSESSNAPTPNGFDHTLGGVRDYYLMKLSSDGSQLLFGTYLGGSAGEDVETHELALDPLGRPVVANGTQSPDFPTTSGAFQPIHGGNNDGFVTIIAADGSRIIASTFLGGIGGEKTEGVSIDAAGNIYVTGSSDDPDLPFLIGGYQGVLKGFDDMIIVKLSPDLSTVLYGSYLGGREKDLGRAGSVTAGGEFVFGGNILSGNFPTINAMQPSHSGGLEGAVVKFSPGP